MPNTPPMKWEGADTGSTPLAPPSRVVSSSEVLLDLSVLQLIRDDRSEFTMLFRTEAEHHYLLTLSETGEWDALKQWMVGEHEMQRRRKRKGKGKGKQERREGALKGEKSSERIEEKEGEGGEQGAAEREREEGEGEDPTSGEEAGRTLASEPVGASSERPAVSATVGIEHSPEPAIADGEDREKPGVETVASGGMVEDGGSSRNKAEGGAVEGEESAERDELDVVSAKEWHRRQLLMRVVGAVPEARRNERGVDVADSNFHGDSALHVAARNGKSEVVRLLLRNGACPWERSFSGAIALHEAVGAGAVGAARLMVSGSLRITQAVR